MNIFAFKIARVAEEDLPSVMETKEPTGEFKTIYVMTLTEETAVSIADAFVAKTKYADIEDRQIIR